MRFPGRSAAFTLLELMVSIGVLCVVLAVLLPSLVMVRQGSRTVVCASNLRQWGQAVELYASRSNGYLPRRGNGVGVTQNISRPTDWFNALPAELHEKSYQQLVALNLLPRPSTASVWICPEAVDLNTQYYWAYTMNMGLSVWDASQNSGRPDRIDGVGDTSVMVFLTDGPGDYCSVFPSIHPGGYNPVPRHRNSVNICFLDGHVASYTGAEIGVGTGIVQRPDLVWHPPGNTWNSAQ